MGGDSSKNVPFKEAWSIFNNDEQSRVKTLFSAMSPSEPICHIEKLTVHLQPYLSEKLIEAVHLTLQEMSSIQNGFTVDGLVMFISMMVKGTLTDKALAVMRLVWFSQRDISIFNKQYFIQFVCLLVESYLAIVKSCTRAQSWPLTSSGDTCHRFAIHLTQDLTTDDSGEVGEDSVERWLSGTPVFLHINDLIWHTCFRLHFSEESAQYFLTPKIPHLKLTDRSPVDTILDIPALLLLSSNLSAEYNMEWRQLFSNRLHGDSFAQLLTRIVKKGPNLLLIRDTEGYVFGGFATESWDIRPQFVGSAHCFLFSLYPEMGVYTPSGYNENYMYLNKAVQTMPNGLDDLDCTAAVWDSHKIRPSRNANVPFGRPNVMYYLPNLHGSREYRCIVPQDEIETCKRRAVFRNAKACDIDVFTLCCNIEAQHGLHLPKDGFEAVDLYIRLRELVVTML